MLEFIQVILGIVTKAIPSIIKNRKASELDAIGAELFWFYIRVNEALMEGESIIHQLERFANTREEWVAEDARWRIAHSVPIQLNNLNRIGTIVAS
jgi:hypothetical protein